MSCGPSGTGSAVNWTRPLEIAAGSWPGPPTTASTPSKPWPPTSSPPFVSRPACFASCVATAATSRPGCRVGWRWPPSRSTGLRTGSGSCVSTSSAARAGWRPTPSSAPSIGRCCGPWPGSGAPPASRSKLTAPAMSWRPWGQFPSRPGAGGPGATPPPRSSSTGAPTSITDPDRALGPEPHDPAQRADRQRARTAIERVQAKQRAADRTRQRQPTSERTTQPRPREQRGRPGPERVAGYHPAESSHQARYATAQP